MRLRVALHFRALREVPPWRYEESQLYCRRHLPYWPTGSWATRSAKPETLSVNEEGNVSWKWAGTDLTVSDAVWNGDFLRLVALVGDDRVEISWVAVHTADDTASYKFRPDDRGPWLNGLPIKRIVTD